MVKKLTSEQIEFAKAWIHDTLILAGIKDKASSVRRWGDTSIYSYTPTKTASKNIWDTVLYRKLDNVDADFNTLASQASFELLKGGKRMHKSADMLASYVAWFCSINNIYWDNSILTEYEMNEFTSTLLGQALKLYDCFTTSLVKPQRSISTSIKNSSGSNASGASGVTKVIPSGNVGELSASASYSDSLSPFVRDLIGTAGVKEYPTPIIDSQTNKPCMLRIEGINANSVKVIPTVFIKPLTKAGQLGSTNKVFIGSANGYTDCTVYFNDLITANDFLSKCGKAGKIPASITQVKITKKNVDHNGYYQVNTEFGPVYITARKLKEALASSQKNEDLEEDTVDESIKMEEDKFDSFTFTDNLMKEI